MKENDILTRKPEESELDFKKRIYSYKESCGFTWEDVAEIINNELDCDYSESKYRKEASKLLDEIVKDNSMDELNETLLAIKKEKVKVTDERIQANSIIRQLAREEVFKDIAISAVKDMSEKKILNTPKEIVVKEYKKKGILCLGDWHYGLDVDLFFNKYNPEIAVERVNNLLMKVYEIIDEHKLDELIVLNLGDMISGRIHLPLRLNSRIDVVTQTIKVSEILAELLSSLSEKVRVVYTSVEDNHSRIEPNKRESLQTESFSRIIDWYLMERLKRNPNVEFLKNLVGPDISIFRVFDFSVAAVHGDKDPQRGIVDRLNSYLQGHLDMVISAHMHHFSADENNNTEFYCNGSLIGQDQYASDLRLNSKPSQLLFISTPENVSEVLYKIKL